MRRHAPACLPLAPTRAPPPAPSPLRTGNSALRHTLSPHTRSRTPSFRLARTRPRPLRPAFANPPNAAPLQSLHDAAASCVGEVHEGLPAHEDLRHRRGWLHRLAPCPPAQGKPLAVQSDVAREPARVRALASTDPSLATGVSAGRGPLCARDRLEGERVHGGERLLRRVPDA